MIPNQESIARKMNENIQAGVVFKFRKTAPTNNQNIATRLKRTRFMIGEIHRISADTPRICPKFCTTRKIIPSTTPATIPNQLAARNMGGILSSKFLLSGMVNYLPWGL